GVLLAGLLVIGSPPRAAQPRLLAPSGAPEEHSEENSSEALRETRPDPVRAERHAHGERRTPPAVRPVASTRFVRTFSPIPLDPFQNGLGSRLRC
ncbi:MAG TPA: hypothetical protein VMZ71_17195, partial [Gemmataceae bacterium]|nr:hypothetical protein [Gemmataceae bacterium]